MKTFWKVLGAAALAIGLTPYKVEKNEETGENSYQALLWQMTSKPGEGEEKRKIDVELGFKAPDKEVHLFSNGLRVAYDACAEGAEQAAEVVEEAVEAAEEKVEEVQEAVADAAEEVKDAVEKAAEDAAE